MMIFEYHNHIVKFQNDDDDNDVRLNDFFYNQHMTILN
jgi:hypothetical protein